MLTPSASAAPPTDARYSPRRRRCARPAQADRASRSSPRSGKLYVPGIGSSGDLVIGRLFADCQIGEYIAITLDSDPGFDRDRSVEHGPPVRARVEFTALAARVDRTREIGQERRIELAAGERPVENLRV